MEWLIGLGLWYVQHTLSYINLLLVCMSVLFPCCLQWKINVFELNWILRCPQSRHGMGPPMNITTSSKRWSLMKIADSFKCNFLFWMMTSTVKPGWNDPFWTDQPVWKKYFPVCENSYLPLHFIQTEPIRATTYLEDHIFLTSRMVVPDRFHFAGSLLKTAVDHLQVCKHGCLHSWHIVDYHFSQSSYSIRLVFLLAHLQWHVEVIWGETRCWCSGALFATLGVVLTVEFTKLTFGICPNLSMCHAMKKVFS